MKKFRKGKPQKCSVTGKTRFNTEKEAERIRFRIWSHDPSADIQDLHVYPCVSCGGYHVGHQKYYKMVLERNTQAAGQLPTA